MNGLSGHSGQKASGVRGRPSLKAEQLRCETMCANELRVGEKEGYALGFIEHYYYYYLIMCLARISALLMYKPHLCP